MVNLSRLKKEVEDRQREADKAEGRLERVLSELRKEFGVKGIRATKRLLHRLKKRTKRDRLRFEAARKEFEKKWMSGSERDGGRTPTGR